MAGLLDFYDDPQANLALAAGLLSGGNFGTALGKGMAGAQAVQIAAQEKRLREAQANDYAMRAERAKQEQAQQQAASERDALFQKALQQGIPPAQLAQYFPEKVDLLKKLADAPNFGRQAVARTIDGVDENNRPVTYQVDQFGERIGNGIGQWKAPVQVNQGDRQTFVNPVDLKPMGSFGLNMSPAERDASARGWASNAIAQQRLAMDAGNMMTDAGGPAQAALVKQFGKPAPGYRWKPDGSQEFIPGGPADQKAQQQNTGQESVSSVVSDLRDKYTKLKDLGGIVSTENNSFSNAAARLGSSGVGQTFGGIVGTQSQSSRDAIEMARPLLLASIMKATGMSAKQMDSNAELKLWLATATDPTKGLEANLEALNRIEKMYGSGKALQPSAPKKPIAQGLYNKRKVIKYDDGSIEYAN